MGSWAAAMTTEQYYLFSFPHPKAPNHLSFHYLVLDFGSWLDYLIKLLLRDKPAIQKTIKYARIPVLMCANLFVY